MNSKTIIKLLEQHGWKLKRISNSHHQLEKIGSPDITIPMHQKTELPLGIEKKILKALNDSNLIKDWRKS